MYTEWLYLAVDFVITAGNSKQKAMFSSVVLSLKGSSRDSVLSLAFVSVPLGRLRRIVRSRPRHRTVCCNCSFHRRRVRGRSRPSRGAPPAWTGRSCALGWGSVWVTGSGLGPGAGRRVAVGSRTLRAVAARPSSSGSPGCT